MLLVGIAMVGLIMSSASADEAFCKQKSGFVGSYCDAYSPYYPYGGYCTGSIECDFWYYDSWMSYCIYGETFDYFGWQC